MIIQSEPVQCEWLSLQCLFNVDHLVLGYLEKVCLILCNGCILPHWVHLIQTLLTNSIPSNHLSNRISVRLLSHVSFQRNTPQQTNKDTLLTWLILAIENLIFLQTDYHGMLVDDVCSILTNQFEKRMSSQKTGCFLLKLKFIKFLYWGIIRPLDEFWWQFAQNCCKHFNDLTVVRVLF